MRIAVTGNIGCGKSTAVQRLATLLPGYRVASIDDMVRSLYPSRAKSPVQLGLAA